MRTNPTLRSFMAAIIAAGALTAATPLAAQIHIGFISHNELIALLDRADIYVYCALVEIEGLLLQTLRNYRRK